MTDWLEDYTRGDVPDVLKGMVAGAAGGLAGSLRMGRVSAGWNALNRFLEGTDTDRLAAVAERRGGDDGPLPPFGDRTQAAAERGVAAGTVEAFQEKPATDQQKDVGGEVVHALVGLAAGAAYGAAVERLPALKKGYGLPLGLALYLLGRQAALPLVGLAPKPTKQAPADHLLGLLSHLAYGFFCEGVRGKLRRAMRA